MAISPDHTESTIDYHFGPYRFDGRLRRLYRDAEPVVVTPKALDTLVALLEHAGHVVEKDDLLRAVWNDTFVGEDTLAQNISTLRRVLDDDASSPRFIATALRRGYRFVAAVKAVPSQATSVAFRTSTFPRTKRNWPLMVGIPALAAALGFLTQRVLMPEPAHPSVEFTVHNPEPARFASSGGMLSVSPDGVYCRSSPWTRMRRQPSGFGRWHRWPLVDWKEPEGAGNPFWSPDSRTIAFFVERRLKAVDVNSGTVRVIASLESTRNLGATWSRTGQILFSVPGHGMTR